VRSAEGTAVVWEYRVLPPAGWKTKVRAYFYEDETRQKALSACSAEGIPIPVQSSGREEAISIGNVSSEAERCAAGDADSSGAPGR
jgi:hypothetical protein